MLYSVATEMCAFVSDRVADNIVLFTLIYHPVLNSFYYIALALTTSQPDYLHSLISVQSTRKTRCSSLVTPARLSLSSSLQITNCSFPSSFIPPHRVYSARSLHFILNTSPQSSISPSHHSQHPSAFHSWLKTHLIHKSSLQSSSYLWSAFMEFWLGLDLLSIGVFFVLVSSFTFYIFWLPVL